MEYGEEKNKVQQDDITDELYDHPIGKTKRTILIISLSATLGFILNFPLKKIVENHIKGALSSNPSCPMSYDKLSVSLLLLRSKISNLVVPSRCISPTANRLKIKTAKAYIGLPGLFPPSIGVNFKVDVSSSTIAGKMKLGFKQVIEIKESIVRGDLLNDVLGSPMLEGNIKISAKVSMASGKLKNSNITLLSNDLGIIGGKAKLGMLPVKIPRVRFNDLVVDADITPKKVTVQSLTLGNEIDSPFYVDLKGALKLDKHSQMVYNVDLKGEMRIDEEKIDSEILSVLKFLWKIDQRPKRNGRYMIHFNGSPQTAFLKPKFAGE